MQEPRPNSAFTTSTVWLMIAATVVFVIYQVRQYEPPHWDVSSVSLSPDGKTIAVGILRWRNAYDSENFKFYISGVERTVKLIDAETGKELQTVWHAEDDGYRSPSTLNASSWVQFSPDGATLAIGTSDGDVLLWDVSSQRFHSKIECSINARVLCVEFSPDSQKLAIVCREHVEVRDLNNPNEVTVMPVMQISGEDRPLLTTNPASIALSPDGSKVAFGDWDSVDVADVASGVLLSRYQWDGPTGEMFADPWDDRFVKRFPDGHSESDPETTEWVAISPDGATLAVNGYGDDEPGTVKLLDFETGQQQARIDCSYGPMQFSRDGSLLGVGGRGGLHLIDTARKTVVKTLGGPSFVHGLSFSPNEKRVAAGDSDGRLTLWNYETGRQLLAVKVGR